MRHYLHIALYCLLVLPLLPGLACAKRDKYSAERKPLLSQTTSTQPSPPTSQAKDAPQPPTVPAQRKVIHRAEMHVTLARYTPFQRKLQAELNKLQGYIADLSVSRSVRHVSQVRATIRVPSQHFQSFLQWVRKQGRVSFERLSGEDITNQYFDLKARLSTQRQLEQRLLQLLQRSQAKLKDVIAVERELARVRGVIERLQGQQRMWDRLVAMATLQLTLNIEQPYQPKVALSYGQKLKKAILSSWHDFTRFLEDVSLGLARALPFWIFALVMFLLWRVWRKRKKAAND